MAEGRSLNLKNFTQMTFNKALVAQRPAALAYVARLRRVHPEKSPAQLTKVVNSWYLTVVTSTGAASGASAIVPNGWLQIPVALADLGTFLQASVFYTLAVAEIHGVHPEDIERRRLLVTLVLMGDSALTSTLKPILGKSVPYWGKAIVSKIPMTTINAANKILGPRFITKYGTRQGVLVLGKQIPLGIGVLIGAGGNHGFGWLTIRTAKQILGKAPGTWDHLDARDSGVEVLNPEVGTSNHAVEFIIDDELPDTDVSDTAASS
jgi:hypothetical protein